MGRTRHEILRIRESRDYPAGRAIGPAGQTHTGETRHPEGHVLSLVRCLSKRRARGPGRSLAPAGSRLEPHSGRYPRADRAAGPGRAHLVAARVGRALHRYGKVFRVRGFALSPAEDAWSDRQPGLHRDEGGRRVQGQDHGAQSALADRLHLSESHRWGWFYLSTVLDDFSRYI